MLFGIGSVAFLVFEEAFELVKDFMFFQLVKRIDLFNFSVKSAGENRVRVVV